MPSPVRRSIAEDAPLEPRGSRDVYAPLEPRFAVAPPRSGGRFTLVVLVLLRGVNEPSEPLLPREASDAVEGQDSKLGTSATGVIESATVSVTAGVSRIANMLERAARVASDTGACCSSCPNRVRTGVLVHCTF